MRRLLFLHCFSFYSFFTFGQHIGLQGEFATSTNSIVRNHRAVGISYLHSFKSGSIGQVSITKGYSSFKNRDGHPFYGNRISLNFSKLGPVIGDSRKGLFFGGGLGFDGYSVTRYISGSLNPVVFLQLQYQETSLCTSRFGFFINAKPKASVGFLLVTGAIDYYSPYADPMLLLEFNAGITYRLGKTEKSELPDEN